MLIADDAEVARNLFQRVLERAGYRVLLALDGFEAVEVALRERPSIVLMDVGMPGIDGLEAMRRIKSAIGSMPIVIASARAMASDEESYYAAGADEVLANAAARTVFQPAIRVRPLATDQGTWKPIADPRLEPLLIAVFASLPSHARLLRTRVRAKYRSRT